VVTLYILMADGNDQGRSKWANERRGNPYYHDSTPYGYSVPTQELLRLLICKHHVLTPTRHLASRRNASPTDTTKPKSHHQMHTASAVQHLHAIEHRHDRQHFSSSHLSGNGRNPYPSPVDCMSCRLRSGPSQNLVYWKATWRTSMAEESELKIVKGL